MQDSEINESSIAYAIVAFPAMQSRLPTQCTHPLQERATTNETMKSTHTAHANTNKRERAHATDVYAYNTTRFGLSSGDLGHPSAAWQTVKRKDNTMADEHNFAKFTSLFPVNIMPLQALCHECLKTLPYTVRCAYIVWWLALRM